MSLYSSSVKRPVTTILVFVAIVIMGLFSLKKLPIDLMPDIDTNTIMVMRMNNRVYGRRFVIVYFTKILRDLLFLISM